MNVLSNEADDEGEELYLSEDAYGTRQPTRAHGIVSKARGESRQI